MPGIHNFIAKVRETSFVATGPRRKRDRTVLLPENIQSVGESMHWNLSTSTHHRPHDSIIPGTSLYRNDLGMTSYKSNWFKS